MESLALQVDGPITGGACKPGVGGRGVEAYNQDFIVLFMAGCMAGFVDLVL